MIQSKRVLYIATGTEGYGIRRVWDSLVSGKLERGYSVYVAVLNSGTDAAKDWAEMGAIIEEFPSAISQTKIDVGGIGKALVLGRRAREQLRIMQKVTAFVRRIAVDRIIVQSPLEVPLASLVARRCRIPVYWMMPNGVSTKYPFDINRRIYAALGARANLHALANSHYTLGTLGNYRLSKQVVHLGIDVAAFAPEKLDTAATMAARRSLGMTQADAVFGIFARMVPNKGLGTLTEALGILAAEGHHPKILVCGGPMDSDFARTVVSLSEKLGVRSQLLFQGPITDIVPMYGVCNVILNTRLDPEPFGLSVIEGMAMGKPVLAHGAGGPSETIRDGVTGWLVSDPDPYSFASGLRRTLDDRPNWSKIGTAARQHVLSNFSEEKMLDRLEMAWSTSEEC